MLPARRLPTCTLAFLLVLPGCPASVEEGADGGSGTSECEAAPVSGQVSLPADDAHHEESTEWWYWTGHLETPEGRYFGFEFAFFLQDAPGGRGQMVHHALTDLEDESFHHTAALDYATPITVENGFDLDLAGQWALGGDGHDTLHGQVDGYVLDLTVDAIKRPVLQHGNGYTDYPFGGYTYYYSRERMVAQGTLTLPDGTELPVSGLSWFDHQWGPLADAIDKGWDWFALQLDDDRELMLFLVHDATGRLLVGGSITNGDCLTTELSPHEFDVTSRRNWVSPNGDQAVYPVAWTIEVLGETFEVEAVMDEQEVDAMFFWYWEGAATVSGDATGRAYIELTGY